MGRINESVYGSPETWTNNPLNALNANRWNFGKCPSFGKLEDGVTQNKVAINAHIDRSLSWCGLGADSNYNKVDIYNAKDNWSKVQLITENSQFFFYSRPDINFTWNNTDFVIHQATNSNTSSERALWSPIPSLSTVNKHRFMYPVVDIDLKKLKFLIKVRAATDTTFSTQADFDFDDYKNNHTGDYPIIRKIYGMPYNYNNLNTWGDLAGTGANYNFFGVAMFHDYPTSWGDNSIMYTCFDKTNSNDPDFTFILYGARNNRYAVSQNTLRHVLSIGQPKYITVGSYNYFYQNENIADILESALKTIACFGVFFCLNSADVQKDLDDVSTYMGVIDPDGIGRGTYTHGTANRDNPNWNWNGTKESNYDYTKPVDPTHYDKTTVFGSNNLYNTFIQYYALSPAQVTNLCGQIYTYVNSLDPANVDINQSIVKTFYTNNPLDCVVSLKKFPFNIVDYFDPNSVIPPVNVKLGNLVTGAVGWKLNGTYTVVDFGQYDFYPHFGNTFLDYSPYTYAELIIPFCGSVRLDMAYFMGHKLKLKMVVDVYTGACTCYILADNLCIDSVSGNCAIDVPISGIQSADFQNSVQNAITNVKNAKINAKAIKTQSGFSISLMQSGLNLLQDLGVKKAEKAAYTAGQFTNLSSFLNIGSTISNAGKTYDMTKVALEQANYDLKHIETPFNSVGSQSAANAYVEEMQARLIIYRPKFIDGYDATVYGKTEGFACMKTTTVNACSGLTSGNINLNGVTTTNGKALTEEEKAMIISAFAKGVIL